jgi:hypothetical protein
MKEISPVYGDKAEAMNDSPPALHIQGKVILKNCQNVPTGCL